jgi:release factor glutamine methyltransferase
MNIAQALELKGEIDSYERQEAAWLLEHLLGIHSLELKLRLEQDLTEMQEQAYLDGLARIEQGEP